VSFATRVFITSWNSGASINIKDTFSQSLIDQIVTAEFFNQFAQINHMCNVPSPPGILLIVFGFFVIIGFQNNKIQQDILFIE